MGHLPNTYISPPGGWRYRHPTTGSTLTHISLDALLSTVHGYNKANNFPTGEDLRPEIERQICEDHPDYCSGLVSPFQAMAKPAPLSLKDRLRSVKQTLATVKQGTLTLGSWMVSGWMKVPQEQATARAAVCSDCAFNQQPSGCSGCSMAALLSIVKSVVGNASTPHDSRLHACNICGCSLRVKVHLPLDPILKHTPDSQQELLPDHCWILREKGDRNET
jgi:hypothetical protein